MPQGRTLKVRKNLWDALTAMVNTATEAWVSCDAVCINQTSDTERNHQVKLMADSYSNANIVEAWLGQDQLSVSAVQQHTAQLGGGGATRSHNEYNADHYSERYHKRQYGVYASHIPLDERSTPFDCLRA